MKTETLEEILLDQKATEVDPFELKHYCTRPEESRLDLSSRLAQVVLGVRRCGKSTLCMQALKRSEMPFGYVNFDDERLAKLTGDDLNNLLIALYKIYGQFQILFMDEMQNIPEWFLFVNRLLRQNMRLVITGSNAKLLSGELSTHLTGRYSEIHLFPFSFMEYCVVSDVQTDLPAPTLKTALRIAAFDAYLKQGGFPEVRTERTASRYISTLVDSIVVRDICQRHRIRNSRILHELANHLLNIVPAKVTISEFSRIIGIKSDHTTRNYLDYLERAYLISEVRKFSIKSSERITNSKIYAIDVALMDSRPNALAGENLGWRLETLVYLELRRRYSSNEYDIYYYDDRSSEADFLVCKGRHVEKIIQVSYDISTTKVRNRELRGAQSAAAATGCTDLTLITYNEREQTITPSGLPIKIIPAHEWLCSPQESV